jgi:hypothetical protein
MRTQLVVRRQISFAFRIQALALAALFSTVSFAQEVAVPVAQTAALPAEPAPRTPDIVAALAGIPYAIAENPPEQAAAPAAPRLQIVILAGEDALNNIKDRTAREPIIQVQDENHKPVAGASVVLTIQHGSGHAGAAFGHGATTFSGQTDSTGRIVAHGFRPNGHVGQFHIAVNASKGNLVTHSVIVQQNVVAATTATAGTSGITGVIATHVVLVSTVSAAAVAGAVVTGVVLTRTPPTTITPGSGAVGTPQARLSIHFNFPK